jgi:hypothetical protein
MNTKSSSDCNGATVRRTVEVGLKAQQTHHAARAFGKPRPLRVKFVAPAREITSYHPISNGMPQSFASTSDSFRLPVAKSASSTPVRVLPVTLPRPTASPILVGDRQTLRALRAAEMDAWEAGDSAGRQTRKPTVVPRLPAPVRQDKDAWFSLVLACCAVAGVLIGAHDIASFLAGWSRVLDGVHLLIR